MPTVNRWQAIVFDLDDTLYSERDYVLSGFRAVSAWAEQALGVPAADAYRELKSLFESGVRGDTFNQWMRNRDLDADLLSSLVQAYREHTPELRPFAEVPALLGTLRKSYRLGLISDGYLEVQKRKFGALGLERFFEVVIFSDQWGREHWKPHIKPFQTAAELFRLEPSQMVYVADNPAKDFFGARKLQTFTVRLQRDGGEYAKLSPVSAEYAPDATITSLNELHSLLASVPYSRVQL
jgi:putative hydrolase of the HAD superfamily